MENEVLCEIEQIHKDFDMGFITTKQMYCSLADARGKKMVWLFLVILPQFVFNIYRRFN